MYRTITYEWYEQEEYIKIALNRPEKRNAVSIQLAEELLDAIYRAKSTKNLKFLLLTGEGNKAFCSGGDLHDFHGEMKEAEVIKLLTKVKKVLYQIATFPLPTICILNGDSRGGGCELASSCDFRFAYDGTYHGFIQGKLGIIPGWGGGALLYKRIESSKANYWLVSSKVLSTETLYAWGWINEVILEQTNDAIKALLQPFLEKNEKQMKIWKRQLLSQPQYKDLEEEMNKEMLNCAKLWKSEEHIKAVQAFLNS